MYNPSVGIWGDSGQMQRKRGIISPIGGKRGSVGSGLRRTTGAQRAEPLSHSAQKSVLAWRRADRVKQHLRWEVGTVSHRHPLSAPSPPSVLASSVGK